MLFHKIFLFYHLLYTVWIDRVSVKEYIDKEMLFLSFKYNKDLIINIFRLCVKFTVYLGEATTKKILLLMAGPLRPYPSPTSPELMAKGT